MKVTFFGGPGDGEIWECPDDCGVLEWEEATPAGLRYGHYWRESPIVLRFGGYRDQPLREEP